MSTLHALQPLPGLQIWHMPSTSTIVGPFPDMPALVPTLGPRLVSLLVVAFLMALAVVVMLATCSAWLTSASATDANNALGCFRAA